MAAASKAGLALSVLLSDYLPLDNAGIEKLQNSHLEILLLNRGCGKASKTGELFNPAIDCWVRWAVLFRGSGPGAPLHNWMRCCSKGVSAKPLWKVRGVGARWLRASRPREKRANYGRKARPWDE